jgi:myo-inositol 2-dehydrogenase/D-chiro-inositol 1-dehydrogenase
VPELRELRRRIAAGDLGRLLLVSCHQWDELPPSEDFRMHSGGIAIDMGVHEFDQLRWLTGSEIERVQALGALGEPSPDAPDVAAITVALAGGAIGVVTLGRRFPQADSCWAEAIGTRDQVHVPFMWGKAGDAAFERALSAQLEAFAAAARGGRAEGAGGADAVAALTAAELAGAELRSA